jgi:transcriptional regulator with XRE-family HTH domain
MTYLRIKELLKERGLTSKELAEYLDIANNSLSRIITEKQQPRFELLEQIADRLGVEVWQLFKGSDKAVNGFVEYQGTLYRIQTKKDLEELLKKME